MKLDMKFGWLTLRIFALLVTVSFLFKNGLNSAFIGYCVACVLTWVIALRYEKKIAVKNKF